MLVFLFTDIEGSSKLWEAHTDAMAAVIARHDVILREQIEAGGGRITKHTGDGVTAAFEAGEPIACALETQRLFSEEPWGAIGELRIRVGLHAGVAEWIPASEPDGGDYFGPPVNAAARVMSAAWGGQILLTPEVTGVSPLPEGAMLLDLGQHLLKNVSALQQLYQLDHPRLPWHEFPPPRTLSGQSIRQAVEERGGQMAGLEPEGTLIALLAATLLPALQGELDPESGALEGNLGVLEDLGAVSLRGFVARFAERLRAGKALPGPAMQALLHRDLQAQWQAGGETALALRTDASRLLQAVEGVEAAMTAATEEVKEALARGLADLGTQFGEFRWMLADVRDTLAGVRARQALQLALQREQLDLQRQQLVKTNLLLHRRREGPLLAELTVEGEVDVEPPADVACPYKGLAAFEAEDAEYFFGREELAAELTARLAGTRFLAVVGPSGSGKSSLVRAGLLPAVWAGALPGSEEWQTLVITPGTHPLEELAVRIALLNGYTAGALLRELEEEPRTLHLAIKQALADKADDVQLLLVVDQFEELFALCRDEEERRCFVDALLYAVEAEEGRTVVVPTIRADFYGRCADYPQLAARMGDGVLVGPMSGEELRQAIERPAALVGLRLEPGLTEMILDDVADEPGALPLLSHALLETFERRRGRTLTLSGYAAAGGVSGAVAQTADMVFGEFSPEEQAIARSIFLRLTELGEEGAQDTRRRVAPAELVRTPDEARMVERVVKTLADARLITTAEDSIEVAHEALIREWPELRDWLDEDREGLRIHRHLTEAAQGWERLEKDAGELYRGARLAAAGEWAEAYGEALNPLEWEFLAASQELARRREADREAQRQRELEAAQKLAEEQQKRADVEQRRAEEQTRAAGRLRRRALLLAGAMVVAVILAVVAVLAFRQATQSADAAQAASTQAVSGRNAAETAQALEAAQRETAEAEGWARATQQAVAETESEARATQQAIAETEAHARATQQAVAEQRAREALEAYSLSLAAHVQNALDDKDMASALALAIAANDMDDPPAESQRMLRQAAYAPGARRQYQVAELFPDVEGRIYSLAMSPVAQEALIGFEDGSLILWDVAAEAEIHRLDGHTDLVRTVVFSPDGRTALSGSSDRSVIWWDLETGQEIRRLEGHDGWVRTVDFSPDGQRAVSGGFVGDSASAVVNSGELILWNLETGNEVRRFEGHPSGVVAAAFSPDGRAVLASSGFWTNVENEYSLMLWDAESGEAIHDFEISGQYDHYSLAISPDGQTALTGTSGDEVVLWNLDTGERMRTVKGHTGSMVTSVAYAPDGRRALSGDANGLLILWDLASGEPVMHTGVQEPRVGGWHAYDWPVLNLVVAPEGRAALSSAGDGTLVLWDLVDAGEIRRLVGHESPMIGGVALTPDRRYALTADWGEGAGLHYGDSNRMRLWDVETGEELRSFEGHTAAIFMIAASADGRQALTGSQDGTIRLWDLETGEELCQILAHAGGVMAVALSPDGRLALSGSMTNDLPDSGITLWDLETGQILRRLADQGNFTSLAFSSDGLAAFVDAIYQFTDTEDSLGLFDLAGGQLVRRYAAEFDCCTGLAIHPDGRSAYLANNAGGPVVEWDLEADREIRAFGQFPGMRTRVEVSPDGSLLLVSTMDFAGNILSLWDLETGQEVRRFSSDGICCLDIDMSTDGRMAITPGGGGTAILWDLTLPANMDEVRDWISDNRYIRELTCEERETYRIEPLCED
jgi:WD40 repeat protein/class 3 adenylate cyclase